MKLVSLDLTSFRSYVGVSFDLNAPRVLFSGVNGSGKSTIKEGICFALTGRAVGMDARGSGGECLIPTGQDAAKVSLDVEGIGSITRGWNGHGSTLTVDTFTGDKTAQQAGLFLKLNTTPEYINAVLDTSVFLALDHIKAKALILDLLHVSVTTNGSTFTLDELDAAYAQAFEDRKLAKQRLKAHLVPPALGPAGPTLTAIDARLSTLREDLDRLLTETGGTAARRQVLQQRLRELLDLAGPLSPAAVSVIPDQIADMEERLALMEADAAPAPEPVIQPAMSLDGVSRADLTSRIQTLKTFAPKQGCVLDAAIPCPQSRPYFTNRAKDLKAVLDADPNIHGGRAPTPTTSPLTALRQQLDALKAQQATVAGILATNAARGTERQALDGELAALPDLSAQDAQIAELRERIQKGQTVRGEAVAYQQAAQRHEAARLDHKKLADEVELLEAKVERYGPSGARVQALADALDPFLAQINGYTAAFGWKVNMQVEPWGVFVNGRPVETYSQSEKFRIGVAIQLAIASMSGLGFACLDAYDQLDGANREIVGRMLVDAPLEQILILSTREPSAPLPAIQGMICYRLGQVDGRSTFFERTGP